MRCRQRLFLFGDQHLTRGSPAVWARYHHYVIALGIAAHGQGNDRPAGIIQALFLQQLTALIVKAYKCKP